MRTHTPDAIQITIAAQVVFVCAWLILPNFPWFLAIAPTLIGLIFGAIWLALYTVVTIIRELND